MNKLIKMILAVAGTTLLGYVIYTLIEPEVAISIGSLDVIKVQDNNNAYITIVLGLVLLFIGLLRTKK